MRPLMCLFLGLVMTPVFFNQAQAQLSADASSAVIIAYNRIGDDFHPSINVRLEQFEAHLKYLKEQEIPVLPLPTVIEALRTGAPLPDRAVVLTFDGAYRSIIANAVPLLEEYGFPYTLFVPTSRIDQGPPAFLGWKDIQTLSAKEGVSIGLQPVFFTHLYEQDFDTVKRSVNSAKVRYRDKLDQQPAFFAYPFGEYSTAYRDFLVQNGFSAAFGQQSGVAYAGADLFALPRFAMTERYGDLARFKTAVNALPLPVTDIEPADPLLTQSNPSIGFTVPAALSGRLDDFSCYVAGRKAPRLEELGSNRIEIRLDGPLTDDRVRVNCTFPQTTGDPEDPYRWRWLGMLLTLSSELINAGEDPMDVDSME